MTYTPEDRARIDAAAFRSDISAVLGQWADDGRAPGVPGPQSGSQVARCVRARRARDARWAVSDSMATTLEEAAEREAKEAPLTDSEVALAKILAAWFTWWDAPGDGSNEEHAVGMVGKKLPRYVDLYGKPTERATALLDRARKAGVLW